MIFNRLIEKDGHFKKIQIKYLTPSKGILRVELGRPKRKTALYGKRGVDAMGVYDALNNKFYLIPLENIYNKSEIWIRVTKARNCQKKNINSADKYLI